MRKEAAFLLGVSAGRAMKGVTKELIGDVLRPNASERMQATVTESGNAARLDNNFFSLTVWRGGTKIHEYLPIADGVHDTVTGDEYTVSTTGHINGPVA